MSIFTNRYGDLKGGWVATIWLVSTLAFFLLMYVLFHNPYRLTGVYCQYNQQHCVYRNVNGRTPKCGQWWDNSGAFDKVNNLKLKVGTCKAEER